MWLRWKKRHTVLLVVHVDEPTFSPGALFDAVSGATERTPLALRGPKLPVDLIDDLVQLTALREHRIHAKFLECLVILVGHIAPHQPQFVA
mgnify:CR=1 FL=1